MVIVIVIEASVVIRVVMPHATKRPIIPPSAQRIPDSIRN
jgi:hypothetical protein